MNLIPYPKVWEPKKGIFQLSRNTEIVGEAQPANSLSALLQSLPGGAKNRIVLAAEAGQKPESYKLEVTDNEIRIAYSDAAGLFYAVQSLRILAEADIAAKSEYTVPCCVVEDEPRYLWRGLLLDEARHFFGKAALMRLLERMSQMKLNVLHWHLNDDQGWRLELKKYPLLTEIGSKRRESQVGGWLSARYDGKPVNAFYTQEDVKEILAYAEARHIMVVPEIDMPGHFMAVLAAYPELSCTGEKVEVATKFGVHKLIACGGNDDVYRFAKDVLEEVADLFPAPFVHIGGDEAPKEHWNKCPVCHKKMEELGIKSSHDLQGYFTNFVASVLKAKGKEVIGWNEILEAGNVDPSFIVEYWTPQRDEKAVQYIKNGGKTILAKYQACYFDYPYAQHPLKHAYGFDELMKELPLSAPNVLGVEGAVWSEWIEDEKKLEFQLFPRLYALAEVAWSAVRPGYSSFLARLKKFNRIADAMQIGYADIAIAQPKNMLRRWARYAVWGTRNQNQEFEINKKRRGLK